MSKEQKIILGIMAAVIIPALIILSLMVAQQKRTTSLQQKQLVLENQALQEEKNRADLLLQESKDLKQMSDGLALPQVKINLRLQ